MDEIKRKDSTDSAEDFSDSQSKKQTTVSNCFESGDHIKSSDDGEVASQMESYLSGDLESVDLNDTSNDCLEKNLPDTTDSPNSCKTDSPSSVHSQSQASKKKR